MIAPGFGGINLEDIAAPRCFEIEAPAARVARHPGLPRRPARHRDRGARRAHQRAARGGEAARRGADRRLRRRRRRHRDRHAAARRGRRPTSSSSTARAPSSAGDESLSTAHAELAAVDQPAPGDRVDLHDGARRRRRLHRRVSAPGILDAEWIPTMAPKRGRLRPRQPRPGGRPGRGRQVRRRRGHRAAPTTPTRSTTCWPSPASSAASSTPRASRGDRSTCCCAPPQAIADTW